jgi:hypothetical protein
MGAGPPPPLASGEGTITGMSSDTLGCMLRCLSRRDAAALSATSRHLRGVITGPAMNWVWAGKIIIFDDVRTTDVTLRNFVRG